MASRIVEISLIRMKLIASMPFSGRFVVRGSVAPIRFLANRLNIGGLGFRIDFKSSRRALALTAYPLR